METDKHYFIEGLFIIGLSVAAALFAVWLAGKGHRDDVLYRIHFSDSVRGLTVGDPVKHRGVDVGMVEAVVIDPDDPRKVRVDVKLRKNTPVKTDTTAILALKGITGVVFIDLNGGTPKARSLVDVTPKDQIPEITAEKDTIQAMLDQLPIVVDKFSDVVDKFSGLEDQTKKVLTDVSALTSKLKETPSLLFSAPKQ
jgi:phospholipid/cholesterol/gamma-HCH transport system substrate-binding protein